MWLTYVEYFDGPGGEREEVLVGLHGHLVAVAELTHELSDGVVLEQVLRLVLERHHALRYLVELVLQVEKLRATQYTQTHTHTIKMKYVKWHYSFQNDQYLMCVSLLFFFEVIDGGEQLVPLLVEQVDVAVVDGLDLLLSCLQRLQVVVEHRIERVWC